ncbi:hypothetical protein [Thermococcus thioreducens]|uniref:HEPN domain-containing protein n=1 Tax=Thermococcus thioreducens TaxID=277988 RepID=A0A0Q2M252_9EURY|nr:hypothetical protein [Thermococcus thioreducens]ASJ11756.1 hypothetical protein A3L14_02110 [Thermococcus thioreducens]KQH81954.1 hypothetical protein AMR53_08425 [Thermococcus thioreducens]SEW14433.1 hypothetical protein SAMN05216170_1858 [Thermococcus thioreducens]
MEAELVEKVLAYIRRGDYYLEERRFDMAYNAYMDALYTIGAYLVYLDTGLLMSAREMVGILKSRHPEVYGVVSRYAGIASFDEESVGSLGEEIKRLRDSLLSRKGER